MCRHHEPCATTPTHVPPSREGHVVPQPARRRHCPPRNRLAVSACRAGQPIGFATAAEHHGQLVQPEAGDEALAVLRPDQPGGGVGEVSPPRTAARRGRNRRSWRPRPGRQRRRRARGVVACLAGPTSPAAASKHQPRPRSAIGRRRGRLRPPRNQAANLFVPLVSYEERRPDIGTRDRREAHESHVVRAVRAPPTLHQTCHRQAKADRVSAGRVPVNVATLAGLARLATLRTTRLACGRRGPFGGGR